uniref:Uncharacterized protein n=1 Tax=viral metagenome TaxID=1070528 RepID=A0A6M3IHU3_9ZZZZ
MSTGPKTSWGGRRPGAGGKPLPANEKLRREMIRKASAWAKKFGQTIDDVLLSIIHGKSWEGIAIKAEPKTRVSAIKVYKEFTMGRSSDQTVNITERKENPIQLPEMMPDPARVPVEKIGTA